MEALKTIAELVGAITVIFGALVTIEKWSKGKISAWLLKPVFERFDTVDKNMKDTKDRLCKVETDNLKMMIMSQEIPIEERLQAGERYLSLGGNGAIKIHLKVLQEEYQNKIGGTNHEQ